MIVKLKQIDLAKPALEKLGMNEFPITVTMKIKRIIKSLEVDYQVIAGKKIEIASKYGEDTGSGFSIPPEKVQGYQAEVEKELELEIEYPESSVFIPLSEIIGKRDMNSVYLSPTLIAYCEPFLVITE